uniref:Uncharacterized protein n=1 Tax=Arion vulgaris TaxID=1028688 RepID=A0A0B6YQ17_9EUPU
MVIASSNGNVQSGDLHGMAYKQLPKIQTSIKDFATEMLLRSQKRLEDSTSEHRRHVQEITNIRIKTKIRPKLELSRPK